MSRGYHTGPRGQGQFPFSVIPRRAYRRRLRRVAARTAPAPRIAAVEGSGTTNAEPEFSLNRNASPPLRYTFSRSFPVLFVLSPEVLVSSTVPGAAIVALVTTIPV